MQLPANLPQQLARAQSAFTVWCHTAKAGHTIEHITNPDYWAHILVTYSPEAFKRHDEIRVIAEDGSYFVQLLVTEIDEHRHWAKTRVLFTHWDSETKADGALPVKDADGYTVEFSGPQKWRILAQAGTGARPQVVAKGYASEEEAREALINIKMAKAA